jgi:hypothetical protein
MASKKGLVVELVRPRIKVSRERFTQALDRIVSDAALRERLERQPLETLSELGIEIDPKTQGELASKGLSEVIAERNTIEVIPL